MNFDKQAEVINYLARQSIYVAPSQVSYSFLDPARELQGTRPAWSDFACITDSFIDLNETNAESMSLASMAAVEMLDLKVADATMLDMCAAPGMKSLYASYAYPGIDITASDLSYQRLQRLKRLFTSHNKPVTAVTSDGRKLAEELDGQQFDRILLDAPCSGEGLILAGDKKQTNAWSASKVNRLQQLQIKLLKSAWNLLKPGGRLVYSTCTLNLNENERVIKKALKREVTVLNEPLSLISLPVLDNNDAWRLIPSPQSIGFFIAVLVKYSED